MSNATNLALLGLSGFGNAGNVLTSTGNTSAPTFSASSVGVREIRVVNRVLSRLGVNKSTGNVSVSALPDISEIPVPSWINGGHISDWSTLQYYLSAVAETNTSPASAVYVEYFGSINTQGAGLVVHPNGKIYIGPSGTSLVRLLDPSNDSITVISSGYVTNQNQGARLHPNGRIYSPPYFGSLIRFIDPSNNSVGVAGTLVHGTAGDANLGGMTLAPNGKFYIFPYNQSPYAIYSIVNVFDPATSVVSPIHTVTGSVISGMYTANASTLAPNGKIYAFPVSTAQSIVLKIDPDNNTVTNLRTFSRAAGTVFTHQNGVYITSGTLMFLLDPSNDTIATVGTFLATGGSTVYSVLAPNGKIYFTPFTGTSMAFYDPDTNLGGTLSQIPDSFVSAYAGGVLAPNGAIYCAPFAATQILKLNFLNKNNFNLNVITNPMFHR